MSIIPHKIENFKEALFDFVAGGESFFPNLYTDSVGIPTIGYGHAFFTVDGHKNMEAFRALVENGISLRQEDLSLFNQIEQILTKNPRAEKSSHEIKAIKKLMKKINLKVTKEEAVGLYEPIMESKLAVMKKSLGTELYEKLKGSKEFIAVADQVYNGGHIYSNVLTPLKEGNREETWFQLRYKCNGGKSHSKGIANRRISETNMFGLTNEKPTAKEIKSIENMIHKYSEIIAFKEDEFPVTRKSPNPKPYQGKDSMKGQLKIAKQHFLHPKENNEEMGILGKSIQKVMTIKHINDVASKEISHSENIFHNKVLDENLNLLDDIEDEIENTEVNLGIILDNFLLEKEEVFILPPKIEEYLNQFTSEVQTRTKKKEKGSGQNGDNTQLETNTTSIDKIDTTDKAQEVISRISFIQQEDVSSNGFERD